MFSLPNYSRSTMNLAGSFRRTKRTSRSWTGAKRFSKPTSLRTEISFFGETENQTIRKDQEDELRSLKDRKSVSHFWIDSNWKRVCASREVRAIEMTWSCIRPNKSDLVFSFIETAYHSIKINFTKICISSSWTPILHDSCHMNHTNRVPRQSLSSWIHFHLCHWL